MTEREVMIRAEGLRKRYGALEVLRGVSLEVARGEVVSIVGASGAGKTTLLQIIGSLTRPDGGRVTLGGVDPFALSDRELSRFRNRRVGFVFQFHHLLPEFTAFENVCLPGLIGGRDRREVGARAAELPPSARRQKWRSHKNFLRAPSGAESFSTFFGHSLEEKGGLCMKKKWTIAAVLVLAVALLAVGTWAYFSAVGRADNVITMGSVKLALHDEDGSGQPFTTVSAMPGSVVDKVVYVENVGSGAFYTRVKITPEVVAANGEIIPLDASKRLLTLDLNDSDWVPGTDGYYYYNGTVDPKAATSKLFNHVTFSKDMGNEYQNTTVHIYVTAEAVQTANLEKYAAKDVRDVWKHVGTVEASTSSTQIDPIPTA